MFEPQEWDAEARCGALKPGVCFLPLLGLLSQEECYCLKKLC